MVNGNHARPLVAFWLLAIAAAIVTAVGLHADGGDAPVRPAPPSRVTASGAPELLLGGVLRAVPSLTAPSVPSTAVQGPTPGAGVATAEVSAPSTSATSSIHKARTEGTGHASASSSPTPTHTATATSVAGHAKGRHKTDKAKATATATKAPHVHGGPSSGHGKGH
jgi:hypothetical protein